MDETALHGLMVRGLAGDAAAYSAMLGHVAERLRVYFRRRLFQGVHDAEDLVQDVLMAVHAKRATFDQSMPVTAWVYAIARFKLVDHLRRNKRRGVQVPVEDADALFADETDTVAPRDVDRLLAELPAKQRDAIRAMKIEELSVRETAQRQGISESDVKVSVHRGMKSLAKRVKKDTE